MSDDPDQGIAFLAAELQRGSIVAAAGCGKTEQIARAVGFSKRRRLILTHTHAGVEAIGRRLDEQHTPKDKYRIDTIAGWCLRFAAAFPTRSGIETLAPASTGEWRTVYVAAARLIQSGAVSAVIDASYAGLFVDEYQDCTREQHVVIHHLAEQLPTCIFGDPFQAIFDFRGQQPVDWDADVYTAFPKAAELLTPWRWRNVGNYELADWLQMVRRALERGDPLDLTIRPACVTWKSLPDDRRFQQAAVVRECLEAMGDSDVGDLIVIGDSANVNARAGLAQKLAQRGFSNIEPLACKELYDAAANIEGKAGLDRFRAVLAFASKCMTGTDKSALEAAVDAHRQGRSRGSARFGDLFPIVDTIIRTGADDALVAFLEALHARSGTSLYRREMFFAMRAALKIRITRPRISLGDAVWEVQNRIRHAGRKFSKRSIGSTLLVKGLQFDSAVVLHTPNMTRRDWYVSLTRAIRRIRIITPTLRLTPRA
jgi:AAA domain